jgi:hypothetical protein
MHMKESLEAKNTAFEGLEWRHVLVLLSVLRSTGYTKKEYIRKLYNAHASHFEETLAFLTSLGAVMESEGHLHGSDVLKTVDESEASSWFINELFRSQNRYRTQIIQYLGQFHIVDGQPTYRPSSQSRHHESHTRNFLMEMNIVCHDAQRDHYFIAPEHLALYVFAQENANKQTPDMLMSVNRARDSLGLAAEREIFVFEKNRVGKMFSDRVEHVSLNNTAAGYDIRSVTVKKKGAVVPRYIEVKAVSSLSFQFHWTRNEVKMAELLGEWYYLYLLPVKANGRFAINELQIVSDPHTAILNNNRMWFVESDVLRCSLWQKRMKNTGESVNVK